MDIQPGDGVLGRVGDIAADERQQGLDDVQGGGGAGLVQGMIVGEGREAAGHVGRLRVEQLRLEGRRGRGRASRRVGERDDGGLWRCWSMCFLERDWPSSSAHIKPPRLLAQTLGGAQLVEASIGVQEAPQGGTSRGTAVGGQLMSVLKGDGDRKRSIGRTYMAAPMTRGRPLMTGFLPSSSL